MLSAFMSRLERISNDPSRIVDYLRRPRKLVRGGPMVNRLGLQAMRALKEQVAWQMRPAERPAHLASHLDTLDRDGFLVIPDFLPAKAFAEVEAELAEVDALPRDRFDVQKFGDNYESRLFMVTKRPEYHAFAEHLADNPFIYDLACALARRRRSFRPHVFLQWVYKPQPNEPYTDYEYNSYLHVDRHYPFLKAFFYLNDVDASAAPYTFVRGSHKLSWDRLWFEYQLGVRQSSATRHGETSAAAKDADRAMHELALELCRRLDLEEVPIVGKKNTLVISNNQGLHRRWEMSGPGPRITANLDYKFFESPAQPLYPLLRYIERPTEKALAY